MSSYEARPRIKKCLDVKDKSKMFNLNVDTIDFKGIL